MQQFKACRVLGSTALKLGLGHVVLAVLAPGRPLAFLGDLGELFLGFGEVSFLEQPEAADPAFLASALGLGAALAMGRQPSDPRISVDGELAFELLAGLIRGVIQRSNKFCESDGPDASAISSLVGPLTRLPS